LSSGPMCRPLLNLGRLKEGPREKEHLAAVSNQTREIRPSGIIGGLAAT
jgi:hypothetical protein